jgi:cytochrome c oxidase subunit 3
MATLNSLFSVREPLARYGGGSKPPIRAGGEGDGDSGRGGESPDYGARLRRVRLGLVTGLSSVTMIFVALTSAFVVRRGLPTFDERTNTYTHDWLALSLPVGLLLVNTLLLVVSSATVELARRQISRRMALAGVDSVPGVTLGRERNFPWLGVTIVLGFGFLVGQWMAWRELGDRGFDITKISSSFFYLLTGTHAVHLAGGLLVLLYAGMISLQGKPLPKQRIVVDATAWYWHFMAFLWIYIFGLLWFMR